jgi:phenylacetic acid degradation operon negative regulatory protein
MTSTTSPTPAAGASPWAANDGEPYAALGGPVSAPALLETLLCELVLPTGRPVPTSALIAVLTGAGLDPRTVRQTLARAASAGRISHRRHGRRAWWTLTCEGERDAEHHARELEDRLRAAPPWDGSWFVLLITVPESQRVSRVQLYRELHDAGLASPSTGVWISPRPEAANHARRSVEAFGLSEHAISFTGPSAIVGLDDARLAAKAWNLDEARAAYTTFMSRWDDTDASPRLREAAPSTLVAMTTEWLHVARRAPRLPAAVLPDREGRAATNLLLDQRRRLGIPAWHRWTELLGES